MLDALKRSLAPLVQRKQLETAVRQVTDNSLDAVCGRISDTVRGMGLSETRGYIRAQASLVVRRQTAVALAESGIDPALGAVVRRDATERLVPVVLRRMERDRLQHVNRRMAA